jgi:hypothetical protein
MSKSHKIDKKYHKNHNMTSKNQEGALLRISQRIFAPIIKKIEEHQHARISHSSRMLLFMAYLRVKQRGKTLEKKSIV